VKPAAAVAAVEIALITQAASLITQATEQREGVKPAAAAAAAAAALETVATQSVSLAARKV
jgi:hypothetical protein